MSTPHADAPIVRSTLDRFYEALRWVWADLTPAARAILADPARDAWAAISAFEVVLRIARQKEDEDKLDKILCLMDVLVEHLIISLERHDHGDEEEGNEEEGDEEEGNEEGGNEEGNEEGGTEDGPHYPGGDTSGASS